MRLDMSFAEILESKFSGVAGKQGQKDLREFYDHVVELGGDLDTVDDFVDAYFEGDGDAFIDGVLYAWSDTLKQIDEYMGSNESRKIRRTHECRTQRRYEGAVRARTLSGLFRSLKNEHPNTSVAKQSSGMVWKGDVVLHTRNAGWNEPGDWIELGFSLSPDKSQLSIYETYSGKKERVTNVNQFQEALRSLGVHESVIDNIIHYL